MIPYFASHLAFYMLLFGEPGSEQMFRINGGYDSCLVAAYHLRSYAPNLKMRCMSGIEWDKDKPGKLLEAP